MKYELNYQFELMRLIQKCEYAYSAAKKAQEVGNDLKYLYWMRGLLSSIDQINGILITIECREDTFQDIIEVDGDVLKAAHEWVAKARD